MSFRCSVRRGRVQRGSPWMGILRFVVRLVFPGHVGRPWYHSLRPVLWSVDGRRGRVGSSLSSCVVGLCERSKTGEVCGGGCLGACGAGAEPSGFWAHLSVPPPSTYAFCVVYARGLCVPWRGWCEYGVSRCRRVGDVRVAFGCYTCHLRPAVWLAVLCVRPAGCVSMGDVDGWGGCWRVE